MSGSANDAYAESLQLAASFIRQNDDFLVVSHLSPDGDAISATSAMGWILHQLGKKYTLINEGRVPDKFRLLLGDQPIVDYTADAPSRNYQHAIAVDCADFLRIGAVHHALDENVELLNIDHHPTNDAFGSLNLIRTQAAATVEIIFDLAETLGIQWTQPLATCIYSGLLTDTGGFRYSNTTPKVLSIAEQMLRAGVQGAMLAETLLETMTFPQVMLLKEALSTLTFSENRQLAWVTVSLETLQRVGAEDEDTEGLVNIPRNVAGVEIGLMFKQKSADTVKVSMRASGKVDVSKIAKHYGGGGHVRAAGCTVHGTMEEVVQMMVEAVSAAL